MTGSLQLKRGIWQAVICYQDEVGKKKYKWISTGLTERGNKKAAKEILDRELEKFERELTESKDKVERRSKPKEVDKTKATMLFSDYCDNYIESIKDKITTMVYRGYKGYVKKIKDFFDKQKLRLIDVTDEEIREFYAELKEQGLKNISIRHVANVIRPALKQAYKDKLIPDNPYDFVPSLSREKPSLDFYDKHEMAKLFEAVEGHRFELLIKMTGYYGFRRSEVLGLRWSAVDFDHKLISVNHKVLVIGDKVELTDTLKTKTSRRTLPLLPVIENLLIAKREEIEENKQFYGKSYKQNYLDYIFVEDNGKLIYPDVVTRNFSKILKDNKLKHIRFHDLRHSCASIMLANGVQMKQIQDWLGHSNFQTTADVYSHLDFSAKVQSANVIANALDLENKPEKQKPASQETNKELLKRMLTEMAELGFDDVSDYFAYLDEQTDKVLNPKRDFCM